MRLRWYQVSFVSHLEFFFTRSIVVEEDDEDEDDICDNMKLKVFEQWEQLNMLDYLSLMLEEKFRIRGRGSFEIWTVALDAYRRLTIRVLEELK